MNQRPDMNSVTRHTIISLKLHSLKSFTARKPANRRCEAASNESSEERFGVSHGGFVQSKHRPGDCDVASAQPEGIDRCAWGAVVMDRAIALSERDSGVLDDQPVLHVGAVFARNGRNALRGAERRASHQ